MCVFEYIIPTPNPVSLSFFFFFSLLSDRRNNTIGSAKYIFADTPDCEVVHGALYACLRALFGLSVIGILVSLFSGMLVYQLLG